MFCVHCGKEIPENAASCSFCGRKQVPDTQAPAEENGVATIFHSVFGSNNFHLAVVFFLVYACASTLLTLASGELPLPIIDIFIILSFFKLHKLGKDSAPLFSFTSPLKTLRIIVKIYRVLLWILVGVLAVCGVIVAIAGAVSDADFTEEIMNESNISLYGDIFLKHGGISVAFIGIIFILVAIVIAVLNVFTFGSFYKSVKSVEWTAGTGKYQIRNLGSTYGWLIFVLVCTSVSTLDVIDSAANAETILSLIATGFHFAFTILILNCIKQLKNSRQIENL